MSGQKPGSRFTDYFVVCGLDVEAGLEPDQLSGKEIYGISQGRRRRSGRTASAGPLLWPSMLSAVSFFSFRLTLLFTLILFNLPKFIDAIINNTRCACHQ